MEDVKVYVRARMAPGGETVLRQAMRDAGKGTRRMEQASGVSHQTIQNLRNGKGGIERRKAAAIAAALDMPAVMLFAHAAEFVGDDV
jgi:transcriptional regulator with XRE-family HTH domain